MAGRGRGLIAALVVLLAACAGSRQAPLKVWALGREGEVLTRLLPAFLRENPGLTVDVQQIPWTAAHEKLLTAWVGEAAPDVAQLGNTWIPEFVAVKALQPLDGLLSASSLSPSQFFPGIWESNVVDGALFGIPWYVDTRVLFYRTDLLADAGVARPPRTWDEWREALRRLKSRRGADRFGLVLPIDEWAQPVILACQTGGEVVADGKRGAFDDPRVTKGLGFYLDFFRQGFAPRVSWVQIANVYEQFADGTFAMWITGPWNIGEFKRRLPASMQTRWSTAPLPAPRAEDYPGVSLAGGSSLVVFRSTKRTREAFRLIEFLARPEQQAAFYAMTGDLPARKDAWSDPALAADPYVRAFREQLAHVVPMPRVPEWEQIAAKLADDLEPAIRGRETPEAVYAVLQRDVDQILAKRRWVLARASGPVR